MNNKKRLFVDCLFLVSTAALLYYAQHPEELKYLRPKVQQFSIRTLRSAAEKLLVKAIKIESKYRAEVGS